MAIEPLPTKLTLEIVTPDRDGGLGATGFQQLPQLATPCPEHAAQIQRGGHLMPDGVGTRRLPRSGKRRRIATQDRVIDRHQRLIGTKAVPQAHQLRRAIRLQCTDQIQQHRAGTDRGELVGIADQDQCRVVAQRVEQGPQQGQVHH